MGTTWRPDTCQCEIDVEPDAWDDADELNEANVRVLRVCTEHQAMGLGGKKLFLQVYRGENKLKNNAIGEIAAWYVSRVANPSKEQSQSIFSDACNKCTYTFDKDRKLTIAVSDPELAEADRVALNNAVEKLGTGKVAVIYG